MEKFSEQGKIEEKYPRGEELPTKIRKVVIVAPSFSNLKVRCPYCRKDNFVRMGKGIDKKNPDRNVVYSVIICDNRKCKKPISLIETDPEDKGLKQTNVVSTTHNFNSLKWAADDVYFSKDGELIVVANLSETPKVDKIEFSSMVIKELSKLEEGGEEIG